MAPDSQTEVPMILWFGKNYDDVPVDAMREIRDTPLSHDFVFHTLLGVFEIETVEYQPEKDLLQLSREHAGIL
jgi:lipid A ethanolaminephosphotransferase